MRYFSKFHADNEIKLIWLTIILLSYVEMELFIKQSAIYLV